MPAEDSHNFLYMAEILQCARKLARIWLRTAADLRLVAATGTPWACESVKYAG